jgi:hypothetical protein
MLAGDLHLMARGSQSGPWAIPKRSVAEPDTPQFSSGISRVDAHESARGLRERILTENQADIRHEHNAKTRKSAAGRAE